MNVKKKIVIAALVLVLGAAGAWADHPSGWGIGVVGGYTMGIGGYGGGPGIGLSLKAPPLPIYWGLGVGFGNNYFNLDVTGDYYIFDKVLVPDAWLHWFLGVGGFFDYYGYSVKESYGGTSYSYSYNYLDFGVRVPIGLSFQPIPLLEVFINVAPSLGLDIYSGYDWQVNGSSIRKESGGMGLAFAIPVNLGLRFWL